MESLEMSSPAVYGRRDLDDSPCSPGEEDFLLQFADPVQFAEPGCMSNTPMTSDTLVLPTAEDGKGTSSTDVSLDDTRKRVAYHLFCTLATVSGLVAFFQMQWIDRLNLTQFQWDVLLMILIVLQVTCFASLAFLTLKFAEFALVFQGHALGHSLSECIGLTSIDWNVDVAGKNCAEFMAILCIAVQVLPLVWLSPPSGPDRASLDVQHVRDSWCKANPHSTDWKRLFCTGSYFVLASVLSFIYWRRHRLAASWSCAIVLDVMSIAVSAMQIGSVLLFESSHAINIATAILALLQFRRVLSRLLVVVTTPALCVCWQFSASATAAEAASQLCSGLTVYNYPAKVTTSIDDGSAVVLQKLVDTSHATILQVLWHTACLFVFGTAVLGFIFGSKRKPEDACVPLPNVQHKRTREGWAGDLARDLDMRLVKDPVQDVKQENQDWSAINPDFSRPKQNWLEGRIVMQRHPSMQEVFTLVYLHGDESSALDALGELPTCDAVAVPTLYVAPTATRRTHAFTDLNDHNRAELRPERTSWNDWKGSSGQTGALGETGAADVIVKATFDECLLPAVQSMEIADAMCATQPGGTNGPILCGCSCGGGAATHILLQRALDNRPVAAVVLLVTFVYRESRKMFDGLSNDKKDQIRNFCRGLPVIVQCGTNDTDIPWRTMGLPLVRFYYELGADVYVARTPSGAARGVTHTSWMHAHGSRLSHELINKVLRGLKSRLTSLETITPASALGMTIAPDWEVKYERALVSAELAENTKNNRRRKARRLVSELSEGKLRNLDDVSRPKYDRDDVKVAKDLAKLFAPA